MKQPLKDQLLAQLRDERSKRVIFVSHCILNENTRYLGGAFRPAGVDELVDAFQRQRLDICQMPCPEQRAWGGVLKRRLWPFYGSRGPAAPSLAATLSLVYPIPVRTAGQGCGQRDRCALALKWLASSGSAAPHPVA